MPLINATAPDARFIYEAVDAAKSLLSTFNNFVDPQTLRYMPSSYYLFIIYSAVFLYKVRPIPLPNFTSSAKSTPRTPANTRKARSTTTMTEEERTFVRHMIHQTIERLQKASMGANHMGSRYARLLQLLWRKPPKHSVKQNQNQRNPSIVDTRLNSSNPNDTSFSSQNQNQQQNYDPSDPNSFPQEINQMGMGGNGGSGGQGFSWLDLGATWNFATQNGIGDHSSTGSTGDLEQEAGGLGELSPFDMSLLTDYSLLEGDGAGLIF
jgi:hypothetical protein